MTRKAPSRTLFITATGTELGKTHVTCGLLRAFRELGLRAAALKPVISGFSDLSPEDSDTANILRAQGKPLTAANIAALSPWRFAAPLSPDMAAAREGRHVDFPALIDFCRSRQRDSDGFLIIEGVGGLMAPLDEHHTVLDWMLALESEILMIGGTYLGSLSHCLTALTALRHHGRAATRLILSESAEHSVGLPETAATLAKLAPGLPIDQISRPSTSDCFRRLAKTLTCPA